MAKLDLHFPTGLIGHAGLAPDRPLVLGTHPQCDIVLTEPDVAPVQCRIHWKRDGYRVEAAPQVEGVTLNGRLVRAAPLRPGDTLQLGETRVVFVADSPAAESASQPEQAPRDSGAASPFADLWAAFDRGEVEELGPPLTARSTARPWWKFRKAGSAGSGESEQATAPGQEKLLRSPLILGLGGGLALLAVVVLVLWVVFARVGGERQYDRALAAMDEGLYAKAVRLFDRFLEDYPDHELAENARVLRALSQVRRFSDGTAPSPGQALREARRMVDGVGGLPSFAGVQPQLEEILSRVAQGLAEQAERSADKEAFEQAQQALQLLESLTQPRQEEQQQFHGVLSAARSAIGKADQLEQTLQGMQQSIAAGDPLTVYRLRDRLVRLYPDLAAEERVQENLRQAMELERRAVTFQPGRPLPSSPVSRETAGRDSSQRVHYTSVVPPQETAALTSEPPSPVVARTTFVVRQADAIAPAAPAAGAADGPVAFAMAGGALYAVDAATGTVLWRRVVGYDVPFLPTVIPSGNGASALVSDARRNELVLVEARTGKLLWRQDVGEPFRSAPLVHHGRILLATEGGHLIVLDVLSGRIQGNVSFPQPLAHAAVADAGGSRLYLAADYATLYVLSADSLECQRVLYVGHAPKSLRAAPLVVGEFLVVAEDHALRASRLRVLDTSSTRSSGAIQEIALDGWVAAPPVSSGRFVWVATDAGMLYAFQVSPTQPSAPLTLVAQSQDPDESGVPPFLLPWSEQECFSAGAELRRYRLSVRQQRLAIDRSNGGRGVVTQPLQRQGGAIFAAQRREGASEISFSAYDGRTNGRLWELRLGSAAAAVLIDTHGTRASAASGADASPWIVVTRSGHAYRAPEQPGGGTRILAEPFLGIDEAWRGLRRELYGARAGQPCLLGTASAGRELLVWTGQDGQLEPAPHWIDLPVKVTATPAVFGEGILVPAADGRLYLLDADSGRQLAVPFQPPITTQQPVQWCDPVVVQPDAIVAAEARGALFRLEVAREPLDYMAVRQSRTLRSRIVSSLAVLSHRVYFVDDTGSLLAVAADDLSTVGAWQLSAGAPVAGPWAVGDFLIAESGAGELVCLDRDGTLLWRKAIENLNRTGPPLLYPGALCFVGSEGTVCGVRPQDGKELWRLDVNEPLAAGVVAPGGELIVAGDDGTLNTLDVPTQAP